MGRAMKRCDGRDDVDPRSHPPTVIPRMRGIQYTAASRFYHRRLWNTGSPACAGDDEWG